MSDAPSPRLLRLVTAAGVAVFLVTAITNVGIVASDDYWHIMARVVPAEARTARSVVEREIIRTPLPALVHLGLGKTAAALGIRHPVDQIRFNQTVLALVSFGTVLWAGLAIFGLYSEPERGRHEVLFAALLGFYFASAFYLTRPMVEALVAPLLALGAAFACRYYAGRGSAELVGSVLAIAGAAALRPQTGIVILALPFVVAARRQWRDLIVLAAAGLAGFLVTGAIDELLRGGFHESLRRYVAFNLAHTFDYGVSSPLTFVLLFLALTIPPVFLTRYRGFAWRARYQPLLPAMAMFAVFVVSHSLVPHKEERFMVPILPLFLVGLVPLAAWILDHGARWRTAVFATVNVALLGFVISSPPQRTLMELARYVDRSPEVAEVALQRGLFLPAAFVVRPVAARTATADQRLECTGRLVVLTLTERGAAVAADPAWRRVAHFEPGPIERLIVRLNPRNNARRGPVDVFAPAGC